MLLIHSHVHSLFFPFEFSQVTEDLDKVMLILPNLLVWSLKDWPQTPPWPGFLIGNTAGRAGTVCSLGCSESPLLLPPFCLSTCHSSFPCPPVKAHERPFIPSHNQRSHPLTTPKFHSSQALFSQLPGLFLLEWVTEACTDAAPFPGGSSRSVFFVCVCVFVWVGVAVSPEPFSKSSKGSFALLQWWQCGSNVLHNAA